MAASRVTGSAAMLRSLLQPPARAGGDYKRFGARRAV